MAKPLKTWRIELDALPIPSSELCACISLNQDNISNSRIDEVVIADWFHLEALDDDLWYLRIGSKSWTVSVDGEQAKMISQD
jgi:hypothetical protein